jgi:hypothetical protein
MRMECHGDVTHVDVHMVTSLTIRGGSQFCNTFQGSGLPRKQIGSKDRERKQKYSLIKKATAYLFPGQREVIEYYPWTGIKIKNILQIGRESKYVH